MNLLKKIAFAVLLLSFTVFVALFGRLPALRFVSLQIVMIVPLTSCQKDTNRLALSRHLDDLARKSQKG